MVTRRQATLFSLLGILALAGGSSGLVNASPLETFEIGPPPAPGRPLSRCQRLAAEQFQFRFQLEKGFLSDAWAINQARVSAMAFYERCIRARPI